MTAAAAAGSAARVVTSAVGAAGMAGASPSREGSPPSASSADQSVVGAEPHAWSDPGAGLVSTAADGADPQTAPAAGLACSAAGAAAGAVDSTSSAHEATFSSIGGVCAAGGSIFEALMKEGAWCSGLAEVAPSMRAMVESARAAGRISAIGAASTVVTTDGASWALVSGSGSGMAVIEVIIALTRATTTEHRTISNWVSRLNR